MSNRSRTAVILLSALAMTVTTVVPAYAAGKGFCRNQARQLANQEAYMIGGTIVAVGVASGAAAGAWIAGLGISTATGAAIGGGTGTVFGVFGGKERWRHTYNEAYSECRSG